MTCRPRRVPRTLAPHLALFPAATAAARRERGSTRVPLEVAVAVGRAAGKASRLLRLGAGGSVSGRVTRAVLPDALTQLCEARDVALVSGTNGKTTTTTYLSAAIAARTRVVTNAAGDNLESGLVSALLDAAPAARRAVLEVDEAVLPLALDRTRPDLVVLLNLSRDQLDRHHEVRGHLRRWSSALAADSRCLVVANADDPLVAWVVLQSRPSGRGVVWVCAGVVWREDSRSCPACGGVLLVDDAPDGYRCDSCPFRRPDAAWVLTPVGLRDPSGDTRPVGLGMPGAGNLSNAAMAVAAAFTLGTPVADALRAISLIDTVQGRYLRATVGGKSVLLRLAKNPAGWSEVLDSLTDSTTGLVLALNAATADGRDTSWVWDVPFERLAGREVVVTGDRRHDLAARLQYAGVACRTFVDLELALQAVAADRVVVVATYTAFQRHRDWLARQDRT